MLSETDKDLYKSQITSYMILFITGVIFSGSTNLIKCIYIFFLEQQWNWPTKKNSLFWAPLPSLLGTWSQDADTDDLSSGKYENIVFPC